MTLDPDTLEASASRYETVQPLATVEAEHREMLPETFASGEYGWRDLEWVVQWYFRRFLGAYPNATRRRVEGIFGENDYEDVHHALSRAVEAETTERKLDVLCELTGIGCSLASAYLQYLEPGRYLVMSPAEWAVLEAAGELAEPYPADPNVSGYDRYLETCRNIATRGATDLWTVYRALWLEWYEGLGGPDPRTLE